MTAKRDWARSGWLTDPDVLAHAAKVSIWGRWFVWLLGVFLLAYLPETWYPEELQYPLINLAVATCNGLVHYRLLTGGP